MDWTAAIEKNRDALKRIVAALVAMVEFGGTARSLVSRASSDARATLPRHLHRAVLRLLRPAELAARRLAIALASRLAHAPVPSPARVAKSTPTKPRKPSSLLVRAGFGTGIVLRPGAPVPAHLAHLVSSIDAPRPLSLPLTDLPPRWRRRRWQLAARHAPCPVSRRRAHCRPGLEAVARRRSARCRSSRPAAHRTRCCARRSAGAGQTLCALGRRDAIGRSLPGASTASRRCAAAGRRAAASRVTIRTRGAAGRISATSTRSWRTPERARSPRACQSLPVARTS